LGDKIYFIAKEIAEYWEYINTAETIKNNVSDKNKIFNVNLKKMIKEKIKNIKTSFPRSDRGTNKYNKVSKFLDTCKYNSIFITEDGLYELVLSRPKKKLNLLKDGLYLTSSCQSGRQGHILCQNKKLSKENTGCSIYKFIQKDTISNIYFKIKKTGRKNQKDRLGRIKERGRAKMNKTNKKGRAHKTKRLLTGATKDT
jgi:hypothetical protein